MSAYPTAPNQQHPPTQLPLRWPLFLYRNGTLVGTLTTYFDCRTGIRGTTTHVSESSSSKFDLFTAREPRILSVLWSRRLPAFCLLRPKLGTAGKRVVGVIIMTLLLYTTCPTCQRPIQLYMYIYSGAGLTPSPQPLYRPLVYCCCLLRLLHFHATLPRTVYAG